MAFRPLPRLVPTYWVKSSRRSIRGTLFPVVERKTSSIPIDFSVFKNNRISRISETFNLQFRAEFFNVLNHTNFAPTSNLSPFNANGTPNTLFGQLTSTQVNNRVIQLALKVVW